jgi:hypothetical protein
MDHLDYENCKKLGEMLIYGNFLKEIHLFY